MPRKPKSELTPEVSEPVRAVSAAAAGKPKRARTVVSRKKNPPLAEAAAAPAGVDQQEVARLAYSFWEARGCQGGSPAEDWHRAEQQLKVRSAAAGA